MCGWNWNWDLNELQTRQKGLLVPDGSFSVNRFSTDTKMSKKINRKLRTLLPLIPGTHQQICPSQASCHTK
ncbi:hypothetical protein ATANTOWER_014849 [Ataeniobius toweri]|uniref:Uncharacterized protein n=1 Tax=Ataeniobius toweri TaxID=208326 RepID=A0ABU7CAX1_9TELE|nr:hypothetical protein [Ataeniobius toweri]